MSPDWDLARPPSTSSVFSQASYIRDGYPPESRAPPSPDLHVGTIDIARLRQHRKDDSLPPLTYPDLPPYKAYTHWDGRWEPVEIDGQIQPYWFLYQNGMPKRLPSNTPTVEQRPDHWINCKLPDGTWTTKYHRGIPLPYNRYTALSRRLAFTLFVSLLTGRRLLMLSRSPTSPSKLLRISREMIIRPLL